MKKHSLLIIIAVIVVAAIIAILFMKNSPTAQVRKLEKFTAKVEKNYESYSQEDLDKAVAEYKEISENIDESKLNEEQKKEVYRLRGECNGYFAKANGALIINKLKNAGEAVKGIFDAFRGDKDKDE